MPQPIARVSAFFGSVIRHGCLGLLWVYQNGISPYLGANCRFRPSCSAYAREAIQKHGVTRGGALALRRLIRCHPCHPGGYDPVP